MIMPNIIAVPFFLALGAVFGSFGNVLVDRLPANQSLTGRSHCVGCKKTLRAWELIPIISWILLRGRCARCGDHIPVRFTFVEAASALLFLAAAYTASFNLLIAIPVALALWAMLCIALIDYDTQTIPDVLSMIIALCGVALRIQDQTIPLLAVVIGGGFFAIQWLLSRGKWVGSGDVFLGAALGVLLGTWEKTLMMLWFAYVIGMLVIVVLFPFRRFSMNMRVAFGPFLVAGGAIALLTGDRIIDFLF
jgi:leader peptidase (prepilin peptidase) / N-methyltransferase